MRALKILSAIMLAGLLFAPAHAGVKEQNLAPVELDLSMGLSEPHSDYLLMPNHFEMKLGTLSKMYIRNPSRVTHYFSAGDLTYGAFTRRLEMVVDGKRILEHKRTIAKMKIPPGAVVEWTFVASRLGKHLKFYCFLPEHRKQGMVGTVAVREAPAQSIGAKRRWLRGIRLGWGVAAKSAGGNKPARRSARKGVSPACP